MNVILGYLTTGGSDYLYTTIMYCSVVHIYFISITLHLWQGVIEGVTWETWGPLAAQQPTILLWGDQVTCVCVWGGAPVLRLRCHIHTACCISVVYLR